MAKVIIESLNPFESVIPDRVLVDRDTMMLMKMLKAEGYDVEVKGQRDKPVEYLYRKGVREVFADPVNIAFINGVIGIAATLITNAVQKLLDKRNVESKAMQNITVNIGDRYYNINGEEILKGNALDKRIKDKKIQEEFKQAFKVRIPNPTRPIRIFVEHKPKVVGWCSINPDMSEGLYIDDGHITDKKIIRKIDEGKIKGFSLGGISTKTTCSICSGDYVSCLHLGGTIYDGKECTVRIEKSIPIEVSLVKEPINTKALVQLREMVRLHS
jgi:hypothetical protein